MTMEQSRPPQPVITVQKLAFDGTVLATWTGELVAQDHERVVLRARWSRPAYHGLKVVSFEPGDCFTEYFFFTRWYAIWRVEQPPERSGHLKCWYCNIQTPAELTGGVLRFRDMALDLLVLPDGTAYVLDREEFERLRRTTFDPYSARQAEQALTELEELVRRREPPFEDLARAGQPTQTLPPG
jgi:protein associated with RNAse G/E